MFRLSAIDNLLTSKYMRRKIRLEYIHLSGLAKDTINDFFLSFFAECVSINLITIYGQGFLSADDLVFSTSCPINYQWGYIREAFIRSICTRKDEKRKSEQLNFRFDFRRGM